MEYIADIMGCLGGTAGGALFDFIFFENFQENFLGFLRGFWLVGVGVAFSSEEYGEICFKPESEFVEMSDTVIPSSED